MPQANPAKTSRPLALRLREAREGAIPDPVARVVMSDLARLPLGVFCQGHPKEARELSYLVDIPELEKGDPAIEGGWDVDRRCLSAVSWRLERVFRDRDDPSRSSGAHAKLCRIAQRLSEDLAEVLWGLSGSERFDGLGCGAWATEIGPGFAYDSARLNGRLARIEGTPEQIRAIYGFCGLRVSQVWTACQGLLESAPDARDALPRAPEGLGEMRVLPFLRLAAESTDLDGLVRPVLVAPLASLWEAGALRGSPQNVEVPRRVTELERRLSAA